MVSQASTQNFVLLEQLHQQLGELLDIARQKQGDARFYVTPRGERLRVGLQLKSRYEGREFEASITQDGISFDGAVYPTPSAAAVAAKVKCGKPMAAAQTNGWLFWDYLNETMHVYDRLIKLRQGNADRGE